MSNSIKIKELSLEIEGRPILDNISFGLGEIEIACLLGPSGCGKTSLLRCIAGFEKINHGEVFIKGVIASKLDHHIPVEQRNIGMVFQDYVLFPHMDVSKNITFGLKDISSLRTKERLDELIELFGLNEHTNKYPHQLSGGQQQRVALARAMAPRPSVLLLDEPFASLDIELRESLACELRSILKQDSVATIMVTHNQLEAFAMGDIIGVIDNGKLKQWDTAFNLYHQPKTLNVANFIGEGTFIQGEIINSTDVKTDIGRIKGQVPHNIDVGKKVRVLIRPDDILHDDESKLTALVRNKAFRGAQFLYTLETKNGFIIQSLVPSHHDHAINEPIGIKMEIDHLVVFADEID